MREKDYYGEEDREIKMSDGFNMAFGLIGMDVENAAPYGTLDVFFEGKQLETAPCNQTSFYPPKRR